jgi:SHS2 domain-containing protein
MTRAKRYEELEHTADVRFRVFGRDLEELFENAAFALFDVMVHLSDVREDARLEVEAAGADAEETLVNFLGELFYRYDGEHFITRRVEIQELSDTRVRSLVWGEAFDPSRHKVKLPLKAVTFHDVKITQRAGGFEVIITCDA